MSSSVFHFCKDCLCLSVKNDVRQAIATKTRTTPCIEKSLEKYTVKLSQAATQKEDQRLVPNAHYRLMQVKRIAECSKGGNTFDLHEATICH